MLEQCEIAELEDLKNEGYRWLEWHRGWYGYVNDVSVYPCLKRCYHSFEELDPKHDYFVDDLLEGVVEEYGNR